MNIKFWWEAFVLAVYLLNRLPTPTLGRLSPFESLLGRALDYGFLKVFGCTCFPYLKPYNKHKFAFETSKCLFLGYSTFHKGYRCFHPSGRIYIARSVVFDENLFPYQSLFAQSGNKTSSPAIQSHGTPFLFPSLSPRSSSTYVPLQSVPLHYGLSTTNYTNSSPECFEHHTNIPPIVFVPFVSPSFESLSSTSICPLPPDVSTVSEIYEVSTKPPTPSSLPSLHIKIWYF